MVAKKLALITTVLAMLYSPNNVIPYTHKNEVARTTKDVYSKIYYEKDIGGDQWSTPEVTRAVGWGDCEDRAILLMDELKNKGINAEFAAGRRKKDGKWRGHAWTEWKGIDGIEYVLDSGRMYKKSDYLEKTGYSPYTRSQLQSKIDELNSNAEKKIL